MKLDLSGVSTAQLQAIKQILTVGVSASAEVKNKTSLCHKSPPAGYPKDKESYGDSECYRYPLNSKSRCVAAWRYVHQSDNWKLLGDKAKSIESKIKGYAKEHYNLDLQSSESELVDWLNIFVEYYDAETSGEGNDMGDLEKIAELEKSKGQLETDITSIRKEMDETKKTFAATAIMSEKKAEFMDRCTKGGNTAETCTVAWDKAETAAKAQFVPADYEELRKYKVDAEAEKAKAAKIKTIEAKLKEAGIETDVCAEAEYWLGMSDDIFAKTVAKMGEMTKKASASVRLVVPPVTPSITDSKTIVAEGFKELKQVKNKR